jgi:hypothetical protein
MPALSASCWAEKEILMTDAAWVTLVIATLIIAAAAIGLLRVVLHLRAVHATLGKVVAGAQVIAETGRLVARALVSVGAAIDLRSAVIAGSVALGFGKPFFESVQSELDRSAKIGFVQGFTVCPAGLGPLSPLVGAAAVARNLGCET